MDTGLTNEQMRQFVEIMQMAALLDEAAQKYIAEFYSLCTDEKTIYTMTKKINGPESACAEIQKILKKNTAPDKPKIEKMTEKFHQIKEIRNFIAHDRRLLVVTGLRNKITDAPLCELLDEAASGIQDKPLAELYEMASNIFNDFQDFLGQLYCESDEEEYQAERRMNLYGE